MKLYHTEKRAKVPFSKAKVKMYTCGPTVYNFAHIGNLRTYVFEDLLRRTLEFFGMEVFQVMNLTDVDDKTIKGAIEKGVDLDTFTAVYKEAFFEDLRTLNIQKAHVYPAATDYILEMIEMIEKLVDKGIAYVGKDGSVYYSIDKFPSYGRLSHLHLHELKEGARVNSDEYDKDNASDFVLWKAYDQQRDGQIYWDSPFGKGRPGWHIECSAMATKILGDTIDLHVGGVDNIFPHHENEIAQSEACTGKHFVNHWIHSEHLIVDGKKMSKSLGNFFTLRDLLAKGYSGPEVRYMLLATHYRTQLNFTLEGLEAARHSLRRLKAFIDRLHTLQEGVEGHVELLLKEAKQAFDAALQDDLGISPALAALFDLVREVNMLIDHRKVAPSEVKSILQTLQAMDQVLGLIPFEEQAFEIPPAVQQAFDQRLEARKSKNWAEADRLRDLILSEGFTIEDTPQGPRLIKK